MLPISLEKSPLVAAIFEVRFESTVPNVGNILPGLLYSHYPDARLVTLPLAHVPRELRSVDQNLRYLPSHQFHADGYVVGIGDSGITVTTSDYRGWSWFLGLINRLLGIFSKSGISSSASRYSLRYSNLLPVSNGLSGERLSDLLNVKIEVLGQALGGPGLQLRTEFHESGFLTILQLGAGFTNHPKNGRRDGYLIDVDTIREGDLPRDFLKNPQEALTACHDCLKSRFFALLTASTIKSLGPEYSR